MTTTTLRETTLTFPTPAEAVDSVLRVYRLRGGRTRLAITEVEHAAQCGTLAERSHMRPAMIAACLLHDFGRLLTDDPAEHAEIGAESLASVFGPDVTEPIRLHTQAWSYLAAVEPDFALAHPAGAAGLPVECARPMSGAEVRAFLAEPWAEAAATVRRIDEAGRLPGARTPALDHFRPLLLRLAMSHQIAEG